MTLSAHLHDGTLDALAGDWAGLHSADPTATPFTSPAWCLAWWRHWAEPGMEPWVVAVRDAGGRLHGLAPLVLGRSAGFRVLRGLGSGVGNSWDVLAPPDARDEVVGAVAEHLRQAGGGWDLLDVDRLPPHSTTPGKLAAAGLSVAGRAGIQAPWLDLPETFDAYLAGLSSKRRAKERRYLRTLDEGEIAVSQVTDAGEIAAVVARWQELRVAWWTHRGRPLDPEHASDRFRDFTADAVAGLLAAGLAVVRRFSSDGEVVGVAIDFADGATYYNWLNGFDPRFEATRLGHAIVSDAIRLAIGRGLTGLDFMIGTESYKYEYGAQDRVLTSIVVSNRHLRSRAAALARSVAGLVRR